MSTDNVFCGVSFVPKYHGTPLGQADSKKKKEACHTVSFRW